jgi:hypothetical protein
MPFIWKIRVSSHPIAFALAFLASVVSASLAAEYTASREPVLQSEPVHNSVDRANKGDRLKIAPAEDAGQRTGIKRNELRPRITKLAAAEAPHAKKIEIRKAAA